MTFADARTIHFIGIGGIGVSALARIALEQGKRVSGSDLTSSAVTEDVIRAGGNVVIGPQRTENIPIGADLIIFSPAVPPDNPERRGAEARGIPTQSYPEALGRFMKGRDVIAVAGTHGKTTTTAILGQLFVDAGLDPTVIVGSRVAAFQGNERLGRSNLLVAEACEWRGHFLHYSPTTIVLTNVEADHLDYFRDLDDVIDHFRRFIRRLPTDGRLIVNADDPNVVAVIAASPASVVTYGVSNGTWRATNIRSSPGRVQYVVTGPTSFEITLRVPGRHNVMNSLAATAAALERGIAPKVIVESLAAFQGSWRRFEVKGTVNGATVIDDYAHHPTEIRATLRAAREFYPGKRIVAAFQPHHRNRTKKLFNDFAAAFADADQVFVTEIYDVAGRERGESISSQDLVEPISSHGVHAEFVPTLTELSATLRKKVNSNDVIVIMGAGAITNVASALVTSGQ